MIIHEPRHEKNFFRGFRHKPGTPAPRAVRPQKMARGLKFLTVEVEDFIIYLAKTNALISHAADLCLCFCICKQQVFS